MFAAAIFVCRLHSVFVVCRRFSTVVSALVFHPRCYCLFPLLYRFTLLFSRCTTASFFVAIDDIFHIICVILVNFPPLAAGTSFGPFIIIYTINKVDPTFLGVRHLLVVLFGFLLCRSSHLYRSQVDVGIDA